MEYDEKKESVDEQFGTLPVLFLLEVVSGNSWPGQGFFVFHCSVEIRTLVPCKICNMLSNYERSVDVYSYQGYQIAQVNHTLNTSWGNKYRNTKASTVYNLDWCMQSIYLHVSQAHWTFEQSMDLIQFIVSTASA